MASIVSSDKLVEAEGRRVGNSDFELNDPHLTAPSTIARRKDRASAPLSFFQERLWLLDQINAGDISGNISRGVRISGALRHDLLQQSLVEVVQRHESLRTTFAANQLDGARDSGPEQSIAPKKTVEIHIIDLSDLYVNPREAKARDLASAAVQRPFDLARGPLLRVDLLVLGAREHVLLVTLHRIVSDECSLGIFFRDLWHCYRAALMGANPQLPPLPIQYADYAYWQRGLLETERFHEVIDYWKARLQGAPSVIEIPSDRPRPAVQSWRGATLTFTLDSELTKALVGLSQKENVTLFTTLLAAFQILIFRYSHEAAVVIGTESSNRELEETKNLVGPLSDALVLSAELSGDPSFREVLATAREGLLSAEAHKGMPFGRLVNELQLERSLSYWPVYQIALNLKETGLRDAEVGPLLLEDFQFEQGIARLDLTLDIVRKADQLDCSFEYNSDLFDAETIERFSEHFNILLEAIVNKPQQRIAELPLLTSRERQQILFEWNSAKMDYATRACIHELVELQARRMPKAIAVVCRDDRLSYEVLNERANQLAHYLRGLGIGPEQRVGVCLERSVETVVALLATLKAGGAYVPLDSAYPPERLAFMLKDAHVPALITQRRLLDKLPEFHGEVIQIDVDWPNIAVKSSADLKGSADPQNLAYVIYTSGSTGQPKGVQVTHDAVIHLFEATRNQLGFREGDVWTTVHSTAFDFSVWEIWGSLVQGGHLVIVPLDVAQSPPKFYELLRDERVTILNQTPSALRQFLEAKPAFQDLAVRTIICGGDALDCELARELAGLKIPVWNFYGPTETTVWATCTKIEASQTDEELTSIGRQIPDVEIYLLDQHLQPVPTGVSGEIFLSGSGVARGYLNRPGLTAEKFIPDLFSKKPGARLYRTGDLARYRRGGRLEFLGRLDNQVKLRGFRIELGEIETVLGQHPSIRQAVAMVREDQKGDKRLVAYLVTAAPGINGTSELRSYLQRSLPEYMLPSAFVVLDAIPLTPNGKVDRRALPAPDVSRPDLRQKYVAPRDNVEDQLTKLWEGVLGLKSIGVSDSFFELGGNSLLAVRLFAHIADRFGTRLPLATLFQASTIELLADVLRDRPSAPWSSLVTIQPRGSKPPLYCVHACGPHVFIYQPLVRHLDPDQPVYGLQAQGLDGIHEPFKRVADMVAHYVKEIREFQPEGPYYLLGDTMGGIFAYEMARQLHSQGQKVALLAMVDTFCPLAPSLWRRLLCHSFHLRELGLLTYVAGAIRALNNRLTRNIRTSARNLYAFDEVMNAVEEGSTSSDPIVRTEWAIFQAVYADYSPPGEVYPGRITYFLARDNKFKIRWEDNRRDWRKLAGKGLELFELPGDHNELREEPYVAVLAEKLMTCLNRGN